MLLSYREQTLPETHSTFMDDTAHSWSSCLPDTLRMLRTQSVLVRQLGKTLTLWWYKGVEHMITTISGFWKGQKGEEEEERRTEGKMRFCKIKTKILKQLQSWSSILLCTIILITPHAALTDFRGSEISSVIACFFFHIIFILMTDLHSKAGSPCSHARL